MKTQVRMMLLCDNVTLAENGRMNCFGVLHRETARVFPVELSLCIVVYFVEPLEATWASFTVEDSAGVVLSFHQVDAPPGQPAGRSTTLVATTSPIPVPIPGRYWVTFRSDGLTEPARCPFEILLEPSGYHRNT